MLRAILVIALTGVFMLCSAVSPVAGRSEENSLWKDVLPDAEFTKLVTADAKIIVDTLAKGEPDKGAKKKIRGAAMMIALYAQSKMLAGGPNAEQLAGLRDLAVKVGNAVADDKFDDAKKLAADLNPKFKSKEPVKATPISLEKHFDLDTLMHQFKPEKGGGRELEKRLQTIGNRRGELTAAQLKDLVPIAYQTAIIAQYTEAYAPEKDAGKKKKAEWIRLSKEMGSSAVEAAKAASAGKPDDKAVKNAMRKLDGTCTSCHSVFRDD